MIRPTPGATSPTALFLAAGASTRYGRPKQLEPLGPQGETLLDYGVFDAWGAGFGRFVFVVSPGLEAQLSQHLATRLGPEVEWQCVVQARSDEGTPLGTAHAVWSARDALEGPFAVANADDWYGPGSWRTLQRLLASADDVWALVGFPVHATLASSGGVSRGICAVDPDGWLREIGEAVGVARDRDGVIRGRMVADEPHRSSPRALRDDQPVSMNLWGFRAGLLPALEDGLERFFETGGTRGGTREFLLPEAVQTAMKAGLARVRVLSTGETWMGITHPGDRAGVSARLAELHRNGTYPSEGLPPLSSA